MQTQAPFLRKTPFQTAFRFTKTSLLAIIEQVRALGLKQVECSDTSCRGLRAIVYPSGEVRFHARYHYRKRSTHQQLGSLEIITVEQAREANLAIRLALVQGRNPKSPAKGSITFATLFEKHYCPQSAARKLSHQADMSRYKRLEATFGHVAIADITPTMLSAFLLDLQGKEGLSAATANHYLSLINTCFSLAVDIELLEKNPARSLKPLRTHNLRLQFFSTDELGMFMQAAQRESNRLAGILFQLLALTGMRIGELLNSRWSDLDLENNTLRLATSKSGRPGIIFLSQAACELIVELDDYRRNDWLFPAIRGLGHLARPVRAFHRICADAGLADRHFRPHDLRHAWASIVGSMYSNVIVQQGLRHSGGSKVTERYLHPMGEKIREANESLAKKIWSSRQ